MEQLTAPVTGNYMAFELARWYHDLAKWCLQAAEQHLALTEDSPQPDVDKALALNDIVRVRMATVQNIEKSFRSEFPKLYVDHQVKRILSL